MASPSIWSAYWPDGSLAFYTREAQFANLVDVPGGFLVADPQDWETGLAYVGTSDLQGTSLEVATMRVSVWSLAVS